MKSFKGKTLRWEWREGIVELTLDHQPANEIGTAMLADMEKFVASFESLAPDTSVCIIASARKSVFSAGGDLRELYATAAAVPEKDRPAGARVGTPLSARPSVAPPTTTTAPAGRGAPQNIPLPHPPGLSWPETPPSPPRPPPPPPLWPR